MRCKILAKSLGGGVLGEQLFQQRNPYSNTNLKNDPHQTDLPEKRVCAGGYAPCAHPFFGNFSVWPSSYAL